VANRGIACGARLLILLIMRRVASDFGSNRARGRERKNQGEENKKTSINVLFSLVLGFRFLQSSP
jgi:hypothetical protein